jgi:hypothetical protein
MLIQYVVRAIQIYSHSDSWQKLVLTKENESYILEKWSISPVVVYASMLSCQRGTYTFKIILENPQKKDHLGETRMFRLGD